MPNMTMTPPPSTAIGMLEIAAPNFGTSPQAIRNSAPIVTTWRLMMPVIEISPTFWLNEVFGSAPNTPETAVPRPSASVPPRISASVASRPAPPLVMPEMSPTVSIAEMTEIRHMPTIAATLNSMPKCSGFGGANQAARPTLSKLTRSVVRSATT